MNSFKEVFEKAQRTLDKAAKLSTKKRESLPNSVFCAPGRKFPVSDCAHFLK